MEIEVSIPNLLSSCTGGRTSFPLATPADSLEAAFNTLFETYPLLHRHICDEQNRIRKHVLVFHNQERVRQLEDPAVSLHPGDRLQVLQNVSGG